MTTRTNSGSFDRDPRWTHRRKKPPAEEGRTGQLKNCSPGDHVDIKGKTYIVTMVSGPAYALRRIEGEKHGPIELKPRNTGCLFLKVRDR